MSPIKEATKKWLHIPSHPRTRHHHPEHVPEHEMTACNLIVDGDVVEHPATYEVDGRRYVFAAWWHEGPILLLRHGQWVPSGTLHVTSIGYTHTPELGLTWGSFSIRGGDFGDVDGTWAWDYGHGRDGFGAGTGADGLHVRLTFLLNEPDHLPTVPLPTPDTDVVHLRLTR